MSYSDENKLAYIIAIINEFAAKSLKFLKKL